MTQKTKLEVIGPYTPEHEGPYAIDSAMSAEVLFVKVNIHCIVDGIAFITTEDRDGPWCVKTAHLLNAREVPVAREFWDVVGRVSGFIHYRFNSPGDAMDLWRKCADQTEIIHVREVLPGEGA